MKTEDVTDLPEDVQEVIETVTDWPLCESDGGDVFTGDLLIHKLADLLLRESRKAKEMERELQRWQMWNHHRLSLEVSDGRI